YSSRPRMTSFQDLRDLRLEAERGTIFRQAGLQVALVYPSPYHVGMSSLGFQTIYRELNALPGIAAERAFLPDEPGANAGGGRAAAGGGGRLCAAEGGRGRGPSRVGGFTRPCGGGGGGLSPGLDGGGARGRAGARAERAAARRRPPLVVIGGPLTFSNPVPAGP